MFGGEADSKLSADSKDSKDSKRDSDNSNSNSESGIGVEDKDKTSITTTTNNKPKMIKRTKAEDDALKAHIHGMKSRHKQTLEQLRDCLDAEKDRKLCKLCQVRLC
jgi:hypothetical protein